MAVTEQAPPLPDWASDEGPWCLNRWLPLNTPDPKVDVCLLPPEHDGDCRGIRGVHHNHDTSLNVGQLKMRPKGEPHPDNVAQERTGKLTVELSTYGNADQLRQLAARAVKTLAVSMQQQLTGTLDDGTEFVFRANGNPFKADDEEEEGQEASQPS